MEKHNLEMYGEVELIVRDENGNIESREKTRNMIVNAGKTEAAKLLIAVAGTKPFKYLQIGTGTTSPTVTDTALQTIDQEALATTCEYEADYKWKLAVTFSFTVTTLVTESCIANDLVASAPDMFSRQTFSAKTMVSGKTLEVVWVVTLA